MKTQSLVPCRYAFEAIDVPTKRNKVKDETAAKAVISSKNKGNAVVDVLKGIIDRWLAAKQE